MASNEIWIVGYGNPQRRDDGLGPYIAGKLEKVFSGSENVRVITLHSLDVSLSEELSGAEIVIFVDASAGRPVCVPEWRPVWPQIDSWPAVVHDISAEALMGILRACHGRCPDAWMVSAPGADFDFGEGLSGAALACAEKTVEAIAVFVKEKAARNFRKGA